MRERRSEPGGVEMDRSTADGRRGGVRAAAARTSVSLLAGPGFSAWLGLHTGSSPFGG